MYGRPSAMNPCLACRAVERQPGLAVHTRSYKDGAGHHAQPLFAIDELNPPMSTVLQHCPHTGQRTPPARRVPWPPHARVLPMLATNGRASSEAAAPTARMSSTCGHA